MDDIVEELLGKECNNEIIPCESICIFQSKQDFDSLEWQWKPPNSIVSIKPLDLILVFHTIDPLFITSEEARQSITSLSQIINQLRNAIKQGIKCDVNLIYYYLLLMKRMVYLFQSTNITYYCFFTGNSYSRHIIIEYMNTLLLLASIFYYKASLLIDGDNKIELYHQAHVIMKEASDCAEHIMSERYIASSYIKWSYKRSPRSISNQSIPVNQLNNDDVDIVIIRDFIKHRLGGKEHISATSLLMKIKSIEVRIRIIRKEIELDLVKNNIYCYQNLAPLIETIKELYTKVEEETSNMILKDYATLMILYWKTIQQTILARSDFACYNIQSDPEMGKRALKRMELLGDISITEQESTQELYNQISDEIDSHDLDEIIPIKAYTLPEDKKTFKYYATLKWQSFREYPELDSILGYLKNLHDKPQSIPSSSSSSSSSLTIHNTTTSPVPSLHNTHGRDNLDNYSKEMLIRDRLHLLNWLLKRENTDNGIITLGREETHQLRDNLNELKDIIKENALFIR